MLFDVLIALINLFDVLIVYGVFGVLFGFRRCDFHSSDLFPINKIVAEQVFLVSTQKYASDTLENAAANDKTAACFIESLSEGPFF